MVIGGGVPRTPLLFRLYSNNDNKFSVEGVIVMPSWA
jgi:hypothetical protein